MYKLVKPEAKAETKMPFVGFNISQEMLEKIEKLCARYDLTKSNCLRQLITIGIDAISEDGRNESGREGSPEEDNL